MTHKCWSPQIRVFSLRTHSDEEELRKSFSELGDSLCDSNPSRSMKRVGSSGKPLSGELEPSSGLLLYKNGFLVRKVHADSDGKRSTSLTFDYNTQTSPSLTSSVICQHNVKKSENVKILVFEQFCLTLQRNLYLQCNEDNPLFLKLKDP